MRKGLEDCRDDGELRVLIRKLTERVVYGRGTVEVLGSIAIGEERPGQSPDDINLPFRIVSSVR